MFRFPLAFCLAAVVRNAKCMPSLPTLPYATYQELKHIRRHDHSRRLIVTDSASSAMALRFQTDFSALVTRILELLTNIYSEGASKASLGTL